MGMKLKSLCENVLTDQSSNCLIGDFSEQKGLLLKATLLYNEQKEYAEKSKRMKVLIEKEIVKLVSKHVANLLSNLYEDLRKEEARIDQLTFNSADSGDPRKIFKLLYSEQNCEPRFAQTRLVGPAGGRPLHICALLAARYRGEAKNHGVPISNGIFEGIKEFLIVQWDHEHRDYKLEQYGKDYCAAVGAYLDDKNRNEKYTLDERQRTPVFGTLRRWWRERMRKAAPRCCPVSDPDSELNAERHVKEVVIRGVYEGETIMYPLVASNHVDAVKWLLEEDKEASTSEGLLICKATGSFFRPVFHQWLTSISNLEGWHWYAHCRGRGNNQYASSKTTYFGSDILAFAARCETVKYGLAHFAD